MPGFGRRDNNDHAPEKQVKYLLTGGGTGGHVYPALAIRQIIDREGKNAEFLYVGVAGKAEQYIIEQLGGNEPIPVQYIHACGFPRSLNIARLWDFCLQLWKGYFESRTLLKTFKPDIIIATGGYVTAPVILAGTFLRIRLVLFESNSFPGLVNKILGRLADRILVAFSETEAFFPKGKAVTVGYPVRKSFERISKEDARKKLGISSEARIVFVFGGSSGARSINEAVVRNLELFLSIEHLVLIHGTGSDKIGSYQSYSNTKTLLSELYPSLPPGTQYIVQEYIHDMNTVYSAADIVVSRAGAGTIMECAALGIPMILIPKTGLPGDHQVKNAELVERSGGGILVKEEIYTGDAVLDGELVANAVHDLLSNTSRLLEMSKNIRTIYKAGVDSRIAGVIQKVISYD